MQNARALSAEFFRVVILTIILSQFSIIPVYTAYPPPQSDARNFDLSLPLYQCWEYKSDIFVSKLIASDNATTGIDNKNDKTVRNITNNSEQNSEQNDKQTVNNKQNVDNKQSRQIRGIFLPLSNDRLEYLDAADAHLLWTSEPGGKIVSNLVLNEKKEKKEKNVYFVIKSDENFFLKDINTDTGITNRQIKIGFSDKSVEQVYLSRIGDELVIISADGYFSALNTKDGNLTWQKNIDGDLSLVRVDAERRMIVFAVGNKVLVMSADDGAILKEFDVSFKATAMAFEPDEKLILGDNKGGVHAFNPKNEAKMWTIRGGGEISDITLTDFGVLVSSFDNFAYLVSPTSGKRIWKRRMSGRLSEKPLIIGKYAVLTNLSDPVAVILDLETGKVVNRVSLENGNYFTDKILSGGNLLVFSTLKGLTAFAEDSGKCPVSPLR